MQDDVVTVDRSATPNRLVFAPRFNVAGPFIDRQPAGVGKHDLAALERERAADLGQPPGVGRRIETARGVGGGGREVKLFRADAALVEQGVALRLAHGEVASDRMKGSDLRRAQAGVPNSLVLLTKFELVCPRAENLVWRVAVGLELAEPIPCKRDAFRPTRGITIF